MQIIQVDTRVYKKRFFFSRSKVPFWNFLEQEKVWNLMFLIFRKCEPWIIPTMFLSFFQISG